MISPYTLLKESGFAQYTAMARFTYDRENTSLGAEKLAEMVRAIPGSTRVTTVSLDKDNGIAIFQVKLISAKTPKAAFVSFKENALKKFKGMLLKVEIGAGTIEKKGDFILKEESESQSNLSQYLGQLLEEGLLLEVSVEELRRQYVESGKLSPEDFQQIIDACSDNDGNVKSNYATWLCARIAAKVCSMDAVETWGDRFRFFDTNKSKFQTKDINQLKTAEQIQNWVDNEFIPAERAAFKKGIANGSTVQDDLHAKLEQCRVSDFNSRVTGREYYVFKLEADDYDVEHYLGNGTSWCTRNSQGTFLRYIRSSDRAGVDPYYWVFVNKKNPEERWQLLYKVGYFCDKNDTNFIDKRAVVPVDMLKWLRDKYHQDFTGYSIPQNIEWLEEKIAVQKDPKILDNFNAEQYLVATKSSYRAYKFPSSENLQCALLTKLGLAKSPTQASIIIDSLNNRRNPIVGLVYNEGNKKAPIFVAVALQYSSYGNGSNYLVQASETGVNSKFPNIKNVNEYEALKELSNNLHIELDSELASCWTPGLPDLETFRFSGRDDVWKWESPNLSTSRSFYQLKNIARKVATGGMYEGFDFDDFLHLAQGRDLYAVRLGHNVAFVLPPESRKNVSRDTDLYFLTYVNSDAQLAAYYGIYRKLQPLGVPISFANNDPNDINQRSKLYFYVYGAEHSSREQLEEYKVDSRNSEANDKWDFYRFPTIIRRSVFEGSNTRDVDVFVTPRGNRDTFIEFSGFSGYVSGYRIGRVDEEMTTWTQDSELSYTAARTLNFLGINLRRGGDAAADLRDLMDALSGFRISLMRNRRWRRYTDLAAGVVRDATPRTGVPAFYREHEDQLHQVNVPWSRRGTVISDQGIQMTWEQAQPLLEVSSPDRVQFVRSFEGNYPALAAEGARVLDVTFYWINDTASEWQCLIRFINNAHQIVFAVTRTGTGAGINWRYSAINERNRITLDDNGNLVQAVPVARQPRQPRQQAAAPAAPAAPAPELAPEQQQQLEQCRRNIQAAQNVYQISTDQTELIEALGFTSIANGLMGRDGTITIYDVAAHRGEVSRAALVSLTNQHTMIVSLPGNQTLMNAQLMSQQWRAITRVLDNSVRTFQQCVDVCNQLDIPLPVGLQGWLVYRGIA